MNPFKRFIDWFTGTSDMVKEFEEHFPEKCIICSYHRFGYAQGYTDDPQPPLHDCKENVGKTELDNSTSKV